MEAEDEEEDEDTAVDVLPKREGLDTVGAEMVGWVVLDEVEEDEEAADCCADARTEARVWRSGDSNFKLFTRCEQKVQQMENGVLKNKSKQKRKRGHERNERVRRRVVGLGCDCFGCVRRCHSRG